MSIVVKQSFFNLITIGVAFIIGAVNTLYLYPTFLGSKLQGLVIALLAISNIIQPFLSFGTQHAVIRFYSRYKSNKEKNLRVGLIGKIITLLFNSQWLGTFLFCFLYGILMALMGKQKAQGFDNWWEWLWFIYPNGVKTFIAFGFFYFFGFYNLVGKSAVVFGPILVGWISYIFDNPDYGILSLLLLFIPGLLVLWREH